MAIAIDSTVSDAVVGSTRTTSFTISGSDRYLVVGVAVQSSSTTVSTITYNSISLTSINSRTTSGATFGKTMLYGLVNPSSGTNNLVVTASASGFLWIYGISLTGVDQTTPISPAGGATNGTTSGTSVTTSITTTVDQCRLVGYMHVCSVGSSVVSSTNATVFNHINTWGGGLYLPGNSSTGSNNIQAQIADSARNLSMNIVSLAPASAGTAVEDILGSGIIPFSR